MNKFFIKTMCAISLICTTNAYAMQSEFSDLEIRNASKTHAKFTIYYNMQGINEGSQSSYQPVTIDLAPMGLDGAQQKQIIPNPKRFGLVSVEVDGGTKFHSVVDLISTITLGSNGTVFHNHNYSTVADVVPEWLYNSVSYKKFDLKGYSWKLSTKWESLTADQKLDYFAHDIPSCLHAVDTTPEMQTPFPLCFSRDMKNVALERYKSEHPEINVTEQEIKALEAGLIEKGLPFYIH